MKGRAGSPYAVKDYYDVSPDYALHPAHRLAEFGLLLRRAKQHGLKVIIDFVPNHVARSYYSESHPADSFGQGDDKSQFYTRDNNFYYLEGEGPLRLPTADHPVYEPEAVAGRVTGNNAVTWTPSLHDWYETVKLNYGFDFRSGAGRADLPEPRASEEEVPETWRKMRAILEYWANMGVEGVRVDMAHMVPLPFWRWVIGALRRKYPQFLPFCGGVCN